MFDDEVYEVTRDEFKGFIDQIKPECFTYEEYGFGNEYGETHEIKVTSTDSTRHFASIKRFYEDENIHYYVYEMPHDDECRPAKSVYQITLNSPEEVAEFFKLLKQTQEKNK